MKAGFYLAKWNLSCYPFHDYLWGAASIMKAGLLRANYFSLKKQNNCQLVVWHKIGK